MVLSKIIAYIFHPVIMPLICSIAYFIIIPNHIPQPFSTRLLWLIFALTFIIPIIAVYILKKGRVIASFELETVRERKFPVIFYAIICFLIGNLMLKTGYITLLSLSFYACAISLLITYIFLLINKKVSLHVLSISGLTAFVGVLSFYYKINMLTVISGLVVLIGIIATSRLLLKAHTPKEIFYGLLFGALPQVLTFVMYYKI
ncbi:MAG: hypothetical protein CR985_02265 [Flavobacteriales bacterium]|nr:MAG: hypothetical protein CR985_02265 [Flavobacteriales bacterium]